MRPQKNLSHRKRLQRYRQRLRIGHNETGKSYTYDVFVQVLSQDDFAAHPILLIDAMVERAWSQHEQKILTFLNSLFDLIGEPTTSYIIDIKKNFVAKILKLCLQLTRYA